MSLDDIRAKLVGEPCTKVCYETRKDARWSIIKHWKQKRKIGSIYYCDECEAFHLTKRKPGKTGFRFL